jgi:hypothetical protein
MIHGAPAWALALCCAASLSVQSNAQTSAAKNGPPPPKESYNTKAPSQSRESMLVAQGQRANAIAIIMSLVDESERYQDRTLRVRTQARAADALWDTDEVLARGLFLRAWETAEKVDKEGEQSAEEERQRLLNSRGGGITMIPPAPNLRAEVLKLAAQRNRTLGETFLARLDEAKEQDDTASDPKNTASILFDPTEPKLAVAKRLELAVQLLEAGDVKQAKAFAYPALSYTTSQGMIFLLALRKRDADDADKLYAKLLVNTANDHEADATTVSLLSSYAFTPNLLVTATRRGRVSNQLSDTVQTYDLSQELRAKFFSVAAKILLRPLPPPDQDRTSAGRAGTYFTIARLLPLFERYATSHVPKLNAQLALLSPDAPETFRNGEESMLRLGLTPDEPNRDALPEILNQLGSVTNNAERDAVYVKAIRAAARNGDLRIREFAEKIENANLKEQARSFADFVVVRGAINKKDVDGGLRIVRDGYLSPLHRVWALAEIARLLRKSDPTRTIQLLNDATIEANRINVGEPERVYALVSVALPFFEIDRFRSWDVASDVIKAANAVNGFSGEDGKLSARLRTRNTVAMINSDEPSFNVVSLFELLARDDLQRAVSMANNLTGEAPRAAANLASARSILGVQKNSSSSRK